MAGLEDHSEAILGRSEADAESQYYKAMAAAGTDFRGLLERLAETVAEVMYDFCVVHVTSENGSRFEVAASHHSDPRGDAILKQLIEKGGLEVARPLIEQVVQSGQSLFRPEWSADDDLPEIGQSLHEQETLGVHSLMIVPLKTTNGDVLGTMSVARDATSTPFAETDLALAESMGAHAAIMAETVKLTEDLSMANDQLEAAVRLRDKFISVASHELRTPLGAMRLITELLRRHLSPPAGEETNDGVVTDKIDAIERQVDRMATLVDRLLDVSRIADGRFYLEFEEVDLAATVEDVLGRIEEESSVPDVSIDLEVSDRVTGCWDRERIDQIVTNLVSNAIKYGGGKVTVEVRDRGDLVELRVVDDGPGIASEDRERIFKRFERAHENGADRGLGLGLWIVREIVEAMGGEIRVDTEPGEGATFIVELPKWADEEGT